MNLIDYVKRNAEISDYADLNFEKSQDLVSKGAQERFIADDLLDTLYDYCWIFEFDNLNIYRYISAISCIWNVMRIFGNDVKFEDQDYLQPICLNMDKYSSRDASEVLEPWSVDIFNHHHDDVITFFNMASA